MAHTRNLSWPEGRSNFTDLLGEQDRPPLYHSLIGCFDIVKMFIDYFSRLFMLPKKFAVPSAELDTNFQPRTANSIPGRLFRNSRAKPQ